MDEGNPKDKHAHLGVFKNSVATRYQDNHWILCTQHSTKDNQSFNH